MIAIDFRGFPETVKLPSGLWGSNAIQKCSGASSALRAKDKGVGVLGLYVYHCGSEHANSKVLH
jgi:hypothetical protein